MGIPNILCKASIVFLHNINLYKISHCHIISLFQELKARLAEEISRMRYFITGQTVSPGKTERSPSELEVLIIMV